MKKLLSMFFVLTLALSLTACAKEKTATYVMEQEQEGFKMTDTMTLEAKGDKVHTMKEEIVLDMSSLDEATLQLMEETYGQMVELYKAVEGVECTGAMEDGVYTINVTIDANSDTLTELSEQGLLQVSGVSGGISLEKTGEALVSSGYTASE